MTQILVVNDDKAITSLLERALSSKDCRVAVMNDSLSVLGLDLSRYDLILCDVMMPGMDGFELVKRLRERVDVPILFLTAKVSEEDAVHGLGLGADDYIRKPFGLSELRAKVAAHLRRENRVRTHALVRGNIRFDLGACTLSVDEQPVALTASEYYICEFLAENQGQVLSRAQIREHALGWDSEAGEETVSMHISNARSKLRRAGVDPIETSRGIT